MLSQAKPKKYLYSIIYIAVLLSVQQTVIANTDNVSKELIQVAQRGDVEAQFRIGLCYELGSCGFKRDFIDATNYYQVAAKAGHAKAQMQLAWMYEHGKGVARNQELALYWLDQSSKNGNAEAKEDYKLLFRRYENANKRQRINQYYLLMVKQLKQLRGLD